MSSSLTVDPVIASPVSTGSSALSAVSWPAIFAGAAGAASLSLVLFILGIGLGLTSISPWSGEGVKATTFGLSTILWLTFTQIAASIVGGYLAGRLRVKWVSVHNDEVYFRDTAHGFIAWSIASLGMALVLVTMIAAAVGSGVRAGSAMAGGAMTAGGAAILAAATTPMSGAMTLGNSTLSYSIDSLFRVDPKTKPVAIAPADNVEVMRIFATDLLSGALPPEDKTYVAEVVAARTGSSQADAEQRVSALFSSLLKAKADLEQKAKSAADAARKATAYTSLWLVISLLAGAFSASLAATFGGRLRDKIG